MKKLIVMLVAAAGSWFAWSKAKSQKAEQALWAEATDSVSPSAH